MPARKFDRNPGHAAAVAKPPRVMVRPEEPPARPERINIPEPYAVEQRVECGGFRLGRIFNACPCVCGLGSRFVYTVQLDTPYNGVWYYIGHSNEVTPI